MLDVYIARADVRDLVECRREAARIRGGYYDYLPPGRGLGRRERDQGTASGAESGRVDGLFQGPMNIICQCF